jgi:hypothetical protein
MLAIGHEWEVLAEVDKWLGHEFDFEEFGAGYLLSPAIVDQMVAYADGLPDKGKESRSAVGAFIKGRLLHLESVVKNEADAYKPARQKDLEELYYAAKPLLDEQTTKRFEMVIEQNRKMLEQKRERN